MSSKEKLLNMIQNMEKLVQQNPDNVDGYFNWGLALLRLAEYEKALMKFLKVILFLLAFIILF